MHELSRIDHALVEVLLNLGAIVLRLSDFARQPDERHALVQSVHRYTRCAAGSADPRVQALRQRLEAALKPRLHVIANR